MNKLKTQYNLQDQDPDTIVHIAVFDAKGKIVIQSMTLAEALDKYKPDPNCRPSPTLPRVPKLW